MNHLRFANRRSVRTCLGTLQSRRCWLLASSWPASSIPRPRGFDVHKAFSSTSSIHASAPQHEYLIVISDFPGMNAARAEAKPGHIRDATPLIDARIISYFGVTISEDEAGSESINGSAIVMNAESELEVRDFLQKDEYTKLGVWNVKDAKIWRFRSG